MIVAIDVVARQAIGVIGVVVFLGFAAGWIYELTYRPEQDDADD